MSEVEALRAALKRYGWHDVGCPRRRTTLYVVLQGECVCGLSAAIDGEAGWETIVSDPPLPPREPEPFPLRLRER